MPGTQEQWLEEQIEAEEASCTDEGHEPYIHGRELARRIVSAWPSSPQGLAVKALVKALRDALFASHDPRVERILIAALALTEEEA